MSAIKKLIKLKAFVFEMWKDSGKFIIATDEIAEDYRLLKMFKSETLAKERRDNHARMCESIEKSPTNREANRHPNHEHQPEPDDLVDEPVAEISQGYRFLEFNRGYFDKPQPQPDEELVEDGEIENSAIHLAFLFTAELSMRDAWRGLTNEQRVVTCNKVKCYIRKLLGEK